MAEFGQTTTRGGYLWYPDIRPVPASIRNVFKTSYIHPASSKGFFSGHGALLVSLAHLRVVKC
jgi:hypothetical protein